MKERRQCAERILAATAVVLLCGGPAGAQTGMIPSTNTEFDRKVDEALARLQPVSTNWMAERKAAAEDEVEPAPDPEANTSPAVETDGAAETGMSAAGVSVAKPSVSATDAPRIAASAMVPETEAMATESAPTRPGPDPRWIAEQNAASAKLRQQQLSQIDSGSEPAAGTP